jgi:hypothetical protein
VPTVLAALALLVALCALAVAVSARRPRRRRADGSDLPDDLLGLRREVAALRAEAGDALRHLAVVRYDAFGDMGGHLSWSAAVLDDGGNGVVISSIHGRSDSRSYAKNVAGWASEGQLSAEERDAIDLARGRGGAAA